MATISSDEYDRWYSPHNAVEALTAAGFGPDTAFSAILYRAVSDDLGAVAEKLVTSIPGHQDRTSRFEFITPEMWATSAITKTFWDCGDVVFRKRHRASGPDYVYACTGMRFDPAGIEKLLRQKRPPATDARSDYDKSSDAVMASLDRLQHLITPLGKAVTSSDTPPPRKPVSPATLTAWWAMCKTIPGSDLWRKEEVEAYFSQCFPDKSVTRERLREVRGPQKSGPKARPAE